MPFMEYTATELEVTRFNLYSKEDLIQVQVYRRLTRQIEESLFS